MPKDNPTEAMIEAGIKEIDWYDGENRDAVVEAIWTSMQSAREPKPVDAPVPMILTCPSCKGRHLDEGDFADKPHHTHACQHCGMVWRPAKFCTVGVDFLPGYKNEGEPKPASPPTGDVVEAVAKAIDDALPQRVCLASQSLQLVAEAAIATLRASDPSREMVERVRELEGLLKPFALAADDLDDKHGDGSEIWEAPASMNITAGNLRDARAALEGQSR